MREKRSPLRETPLRVPGQSSDEAIERLVADEELKYIVFAAGFSGLAITEWYRWLTKAPYVPILMSIAAAVVVAYCLFKIRRIQAQINDFKLGRDGERAVAEVLDSLKSKAYAVLHDVAGNGFNVDHVVISSRGIFAIETKTPRKAKGDRIRVEEGRLFVGTASWGESAIEQAIAAGQWLYTLLKTSTGKHLPVRAVLVFPDWSVDPISPELKRRLWVLNPKALPAWIENERTRIPEEDVHLATFHLSRYVHVTGTKSA